MLSLLKSKTSQFVVHLGHACTFQKCVGVTRSTLRVQSLDDVSPCVRRPLLVQRIDHYRIDIIQQSMRCTREASSRKKRRHPEIRREIWSEQLPHDFGMHTHPDGARRVYNPNSIRSVDEPQHQKGGLHEANRRGEYHRSTDLAIIPREGEPAHVSLSIRRTDRTIKTAETPFKCIGRRIRIGHYGVI